MMTKMERELIFKLNEMALKQEKEDKKIEAGNVKLGQKIVVEDENGKETWTAIKYQDGGTVFLLDREYAITINKFGKNNNYNESIARKNSNDCVPSRRALGIFRKDAFIQTEIDLISLDGLRDYGVRKGDLFGVINHRMYQDNRGNIHVSAMYLSTPESTLSGCGAGGVQCVNSNGCVGYGWHDGSGAVRPFFILKSSIFVSLAEA